MAAGAIWKRFGPHVIDSAKCTEMARIIDKEHAARQLALKEACDWIENRLAVEGHPIPASMSLLVGWRSQL